MMTLLHTRWMLALGLLLFLLTVLILFYAIHFASSVHILSFLPSIQNHNH